MGAKVEISDPFDLKGTQEKFHRLLESDQGAKVLIMRQSCALSPEKKAEKKYNIQIDDQLCLGESCGCNRLCTRIFRCPGLVWDKEIGASRIDEVICSGCGVCADICPQGAIITEEA
jgi:indolepyruvate ferredoxin oxidoreductase alpha subunit